MVEKKPKGTKLLSRYPSVVFKLSVSRNRIKRQMREAYRLHKHLLTNESGKEICNDLYLSR